LDDDADEELLNSLEALAQKEEAGRRYEGRNSGFADTGSYDDNMFYD
jgi:hypothetical protein